MYIYLSEVQGVMDDSAIWKQRETNMIELHSRLLLEA